MGVAPVGNRKYFTFDGETSKKYNTHITGKGVFNAPVRAVEMINIPNRNGAYAQDLGYFENVELTYSASIAAESVAEFAQAVSDLRNWLCSKKGYCRLEDEYNPNEYRMAVYKHGLEVEPFLAQTGEFNIVFDCKPQRFLTSGETAVSVASGGTLTNPTLFDAKPLIEAIGYGTMNIGASVAKVANIPIGDLVVFGGDHAVSKTMTITIDDTYANNGDSINGVYAECQTSWTISSGSLSSLSVTFSGSGNGNVIHSAIGKTINLDMGNGANAFLYGTSRTDSVTFSVSVTSSQYGTLSGSVVLSIAYNGSNRFTATATVTLPSHFTEGTSYISMDEIVLNSTKTSITTPIYLDMDIGEAYTINNGVVTSMNNIVQLPAELPTLASGNNTITYDNTFTSFKVLPRWWKV